MSRGAGLHRLAGGIAKREREAWERIDAGQECRLHECREMAVALIQNTLGEFGPACRWHADQGEALGYTVLRRGEL